MIKVAIDSKPLTSGHLIRGIGVHTRQLIDEIVKTNKNVKIESLDFDTSDLSKYDIAHFTSFNPYLTKLPSQKLSKKWILTIHDLIPLIYPNKYPSGILGKINLWGLKKKLKNVDRIITISETSKKDIYRLLPVKPEKIKVIYLAAADFYKKTIDNGWKNGIVKKYNLPDSFVLYVGDVNYNKNINILAEACKKAKVKLVMVGKAATKKNINLNHPENESFKNFLEKYENDTDIIRTGFVPDEDLNLIYNLASVYAAPSLYEGFDFNALQALKVNIPVVASDINVHREILKDACYYANPLREDDFAQKISQLLVNRKDQKVLIERGNKLAENYSWKKTAKETIKVYEETFKGN